MLCGALPPRCGDTLRARKARGASCNKRTVTSSLRRGRPAERRTRLALQSSRPRRRVPLRRGDRRHLPGHDSTGSRLDGSCPPIYARDLRPLRRAQGCTNARCIAFEGPLALAAPQERHRRPPGTHRRPPATDDLTNLRLPSEICQGAVRNIRFARDRALGWSAQAAGRTVWLRAIWLSDVSHDVPTVQRPQPRCRRPDKPNAERPTPKRRSLRPADVPRARAGPKPNAERPEPFIVER